MQKAKMHGIYLTLAVAIAATQLPSSAFGANVFGTSTPAIAIDQDKASVELGLRFSSSVAGKITAIRFYRGVEDRSGYVVHLWSSTGTSLATRSVAANSAATAGWREVALATPVSITAGTTYVASYFAANGSYAATNGGLASTRVSGPLTASAGSGVYRYTSTSAFPSSVYQNSNYFVDVTFVAATTAAKPAVSLSANPATIAAGKASTLTWSSTGATSCEGFRFTAGRVNGTASTAPSTSTNYAVTCTGAGGSATATATVTVTATSPAKPAAFDPPGPSATTFQARPFYTCVTNRYVATAANGGSDSNNGTQATNAGGGNGPWLTIAKAAASVPSPAPGWCVNIGPGTYSVGGINVAKGGNVASMTGFLVFRSTTLLGAKLVASSSGGNIFNVNAPYVIFDGLELSGENRAVHGINTCTGGPTYNGIHHITVMNSYIHNMNENGIATCWAEYYRIYRNKLNSNAYSSWNSGASTYQPIVIPGYVETTYDKAFAPYHNIYLYNSASNNFTSPAGGPHTDGNGIIYDDTQHTQSAPNVVYTPKALLMGNVTWSNGGAGIQIGPTSANADVFNNTAYNNYRDTYNTGTWRGDLSSSITSGVNFKNNIAYSMPGSGILANNSPYLGGNPKGTNSWSNNIAFGASPNMTSPNVFSSTTNKVATNPRFVDPAAGNFALCTGVAAPAATCSGASPGLGYGVVVPFWVQQTAGAIDVGACPSGLAKCP